MEDEVEIEIEEIDADFADKHEDQIMEEGNINLKRFYLILLFRN